MLKKIFIGILIFSIYGNTFSDLMVTDYKCKNCPLQKMPSFGYIIDNLVYSYTKEKRKIISPVFIYLIFNLALLLGLVYFRNKQKNH